MSAIERITKAAHLIDMNDINPRGESYSTRGC